MHVEKLMKRDVRTCKRDDSLEVPARTMWEHDCGCVPVVDDDGHVVGMLTDRDICMAAYTRGAPLASLRVDGTMATTVYCCSPKDSLVTAEQIMRANQIRRLPVAAADGRLVGILSLNDLARQAASGHGRKAKADVTPKDVSDTLAAICQPRCQEEAAAHVA
jgi:CBS domain-containing protein